MNYRYIILHVCIAAVFLSCTTSPDSENIFPAQELVTHKMDSLMQFSDLPALVAIAASKDGDRVTYTYGSAVWNETEPVTTDHIFRIASMTKLITAIAALQLVESGELKPDEDLSSIIPELSEIPVLSNEGTLMQSDKPVTLRHLLTHTSGFGYTLTDSLLHKHDRTNWDYEDLPRRFESGERFLYGSSMDWTGKVIERVSGLSLEEYFIKNITGPLEMHHTRFNVPDSLKQKFVSYGNRGVDGTDELTELSPRIPERITQTYNGGGGLYSSPEDYNKVLRSLLNNGVWEGVRILEKESVDVLFEPQLNDISMNIEDNYFRKGICCDFRGIIKPGSNWGFGGLIDTEATSYGRKEGTLLWGGLYNTYWFIDRKSGIAVSMYSQHLPFNHPATTRLFEEFSALIYSDYE